MAQRSSFDLEHLLYAGTLVFALALRVPGLGTLPLTEQEAAVAVPAYQLSTGQAVDLGADPAYFLLTSLLFAILPSNEFLARFWPALFGIALVLLPYFWRDTLGRKPAVLLSFALAIDPGMVAVSHLASGRMLALSAALFALTAWRHKQPVAAGILAAVALLSAPTLYIGILAFALTRFLSASRNAKSEKQELRPAIIAGAATLLFGGTLFFTAPQGLSGVGNVASGFLQGWWQGPGVGMLGILFALVGYALPALVFGLIGGVRAWTQDLSFGRNLSLFALFALMLVIVYPGRQVADLLWVSLPLWALAAQEISRYLQIPEEERRAAFGTMSLVLLLGIFFYLTLAKLTFNEIGSEAFQNYLLVAGAVLLLGLLATVLISFGWSRRAASNGLVWALLILFGISLLSASARFARQTSIAANELWAPGPAAGQSSLLIANLNDLSSRQEGGTLQAVPVDLRTESAALQWAVRDWPEDSGDGNLSPDLFVTLADAQPEEAATYRGQTFALKVQRAWADFPPNVFSWLLYRQAPTFKQEAVLWARLELFPDGALFLQTESDSGETLE
ncbi:MAG: hypothetical protein WEC37_05135 [Anaerolineales bacterium]